ncbi:hypothetical protein [Piscinibacter terrae]|uniref:hypothetical protein n=1 Tax=Piscinibacter terrae TaxID=2496871 RepID=UPI000F5AADA6|nr:hypothetical protein [Albitalea terrae]
MTLPNAELVMDTIARLLALEDSPRACAQPMDRQDGPLRLLCSSTDAEGQVRCDALLRLPPDRTLTLTLCRDGASPWLARGARRQNEGDLLRVNGSVMTVEQAIAHLDGPAHDTAAATRLVDACLVQAQLKQHPTEVSDLELQRAVEGLRRAHRLYTAADTRRWMDQRGLSDTELEGLAVDHAAVALLRSRIAAGRVDEHFERHRGDLDVAHIAQIHFTNRDEARQIHADIQAGGSISSPRRKIGSGVAMRPRPACSGGFAAGPSPRLCLLECSMRLRANCWPRSTLPMAPGWSRCSPSPKPVWTKPRGT